MPILRPSAAASVLVTAMSLHTQNKTPEKKPGTVLEGFLSSFSVPWWDLHKKPHESELRNLSSGLSVGWKFAYPLLRNSYQARTGKGVQGVQDATNLNGSVPLKYTPLGSWFGSVSIYHYVDQQHRAPWNQPLATSLVMTIGARIRSALPILTAVVIVFSLSVPRETVFPRPSPGPQADTFVWGGLVCAGLTGF